MRGDERLDRRHSHHRRVADDVVHLVASEHGLRERQPHDGFRGRHGGVQQGEVGRVAGHALDACTEFPSGAIEHRHFVAGAEPQDVREMPRFVCVEARGGGRGVDRAEEAWQHGVYSLSLPLLFKGQELGKYKIGAQLGSGGFGTVYLAQDTWIDKKVAIKVPHRQNLDFGELLREPRLLASVSHPNIVAITTAEKQEGVFFIVMEYVPGETLESV